MWSCVQLPASLLTSEQPVGVMPPLPIQPTVTLPLVLTLIRDSFQYEVGQDDNAESRALLASLVSLQNEPYGWNAIVQPRLRYHDLERPDRSVCRLMGSTPRLSDHLSPTALPHGPICQ